MTDKQKELDSKIKLQVLNIIEYIKNNYKDHIIEPKNDIRYSLSGKSDSKDSEIKFCLKEKDEKETKIEIENFINLYVKPTFKQILLEYIDKSGEKDSIIYKRAGIDRKLFSKILKDKYYHPSKSTVFAFAFALRLDYENFLKFLESAGYTLSKSVKRDLIIEYLIINKEYDLFTINIILNFMNEKII